MRLQFHRFTSPCYNNKTCTQHEKNIKYKHKRTYASEMGPVWQNPIQRTKNCSSKCGYDCAQLQYRIQHRTVLIIARLTPSDVTIWLYRFRFDFSINYSTSIWFNSIFYDLHTSVDPTRFLCGRVGTAVLHCWPPTKLSPTAAAVVGLNGEDVEWAKYRSNSVALWHGAEAAKLDSARRHTLTLSIVWCSV